MTASSEIFLADGHSYQLSISAEEAVKKLTDAEEQLKSEMVSFYSLNEKELFVNPHHVVMVSDYHSPEAHTSIDLSETRGGEERKEHNLKEAQKFNEEIDNME